MKRKNLSLEQKIFNYSLTAGMVLATQSALNATVQITLVNPPNGTTISGSGGNIALNLDGAGQNDIQLLFFNLATYLTVDALSGVTTAQYLGKQQAANALYAMVRTQNQSIPVTPPAGKVWGTGDFPNPTGGGTLAYKANGYWHNITNGFLGVRIVVGGQTHYCWVKLSVSGAPNTTSATITAFGYNTVAGQGITPQLPVELMNFTATKLLHNEIELNWTTATEVNNTGFVIERSNSANKESWEKIGFVNGAGNSNSTKQYTFVDDTPLKGDVYYRLKQVDNDGSFTYSKELVVNLTSPLQFALGQNYPNPFNPSTKINFTIPEGGEVTLKVYNVVGEEVADLVNHFLDAGIYSTDFKANELPSGVYVYKLDVKGKFSAERKMNLIK